MCDKFIIEQLIKFKVKRTTRLQTHTHTQLQNKNKIMREQNLNKFYCQYNNCNNYKTAT